MNRRRTRSKWLVTLFLTAAMAVGGTVLSADAPGRDILRELEIEAELKVVAPTAVDVFRAATEALDADDGAAAEAGYRRVLELAPDFDAALRRLGGALANQGKAAEGLPVLERVLTGRRSPENRLEGREPGGPPCPWLCAGERGLPLRA